MFRGRYEHTVDEKGRTSIPRRFRELLSVSSEGRLVVTAGLDPCLVVYPLGEWQEFERRVAERPQFDPAVVRLKRVYIASAVECQADSHGRILIPPVLRQHAGIERDVVWAGMVRFVEVWAQDRWEEAERRARDELGGLGKSLADLGL